MTAFKNLIVESNVLVPLDVLAKHPQNWRKHSEEQKDALRIALDDGIAANNIANRRTGHIVNGHLRFELAQELGHDRVSVDWLDVDVALEKRLLVRIDGMPLLADVDTVQLEDLIGSLGVEEIVLRDAMVDLIEVEGLTAAIDDEEPQRRLVQREGGGNPASSADSEGECEHSWVCEWCGAEDADED